MWVLTLGAFHCSGGLVRSEGPAPLTGVDEDDEEHTWETSPAPHPWCSTLVPADAQDEVKGFEPV